jgi:hypothetical protein
MEYRNRSHHGSRSFNVVTSSGRAVSLCQTLVSDIRDNSAAGCRRRVWACVRKPISLNHDGLCTLSGTVTQAAIQVADAASVSTVAAAPSVMRQLFPAVAVTFLRSKWASVSHAQSQFPSTGKRELQTTSQTNPMYRGNDWIGKGFDPRPSHCRKREPALRMHHGTRPIQSLRA